MALGLGRIYAAEPSLVWQDSSMWADASALGARTRCLLWEQKLPRGTRQCSVQAPATMTRSRQREAEGIHGDVWWLTPLEEHRDRNKGSLFHAGPREKILRSAQGKCVKLTAGKQYTENIQQRQQHTSTPICLPAKSQYCEERVSWETRRCRDMHSQAVAMRSPFLHPALTLRAYVICKGHGETGSLCAVPGPLRKLVLTRLWSW